ncbi:hypothetical protein CTM88_18070 [Photobacterium aquimaris]|uniref:Pili assembly chaperone n=1 Tax=Photobacterium aquimaris TaxID=512643 RepID=A0A2T3IFN3_9GAMM|nr:hypothetical protein [Photobacterium aquimaris]OBU22022.1 hypothetical protein AYY20_12580 [Photobacterium aquimaris]PSU25118.1 hypothetical protein CTM88_18070 [Photobacterium aquimaris]
MKKMISTINSALKNKKIALFTVFACMISTPAMAGTGGGAFEGSWDMLSELAMGYPGQILAFLTICGVLFFSVVRPNLIGLGGSVIIMVVLAQLKSIVNGFLDAGLPIL